MVIAALLCFGLLLVAWILAPDRRSGEVEPAAGPLETQRIHEVGAATADQLPVVTA